MCTLKTIRKMADKLYEPGRHGFARLLCAWLRVNLHNEPNLTLMSVGSSAREAFKACESLAASGPVPEDRDLMERCILSYEKEQLTGFHLLLTVCNTPESRFFFILSKSGVNMTMLRRKLEEKIQDLRRSAMKPNGHDQHAANGVLAGYGRDLTTLALNGEFNELSDRDELPLVMDALMKRQKRNVALTGPAGVGKTCLVETLARKIALKEGPGSFLPTNVFELSIGKIVAGTRFRGDFEDRMYAVLEAVEKQEWMILFIDEMHLIRGAGRAEGVIMDAANILKPFLARDKVRLIGATTHEEYELYIRTDPALERRFQEVVLERPGPALLKQMVQRQAGILEEYHGIRIPGELVQHAMDLTDRYLSDRNQPDKSVDLLDSSAAYAYRNARPELSLNDLYSVLSGWIGRRITVPESRSPFLRTGKGIPGDYEKRCDTILFNGSDQGQAKRLLENCLSEITSRLSGKQIELIFDEERLMIYLLEEWRCDPQQERNMTRFVERLLLTPVAELLSGKGHSEGRTRIVLREEFFTSGVVAFLESEPVTQS